MRRRELHDFTLRAIAATGGSAEFKDRSCARPTWDGTMWHLGRLKHEMHVLHKVAHWLAVPPRWRRLPNYGLGRDPDGGPSTLPFFAQHGRDRSEVDATLLELGIPRAVTHLFRSPEGEDAFKLWLEARLSLEEELAAMLTVHLVRFAGLDWRAAARTCSFHTITQTETGQAKFWGLAHKLAERGVNVWNPIPGVTGP